MKAFNMLIVILLFSTMALFGHAAVSFAEEHSPAEIQTLRNAVTALQTINPGLSSQLSKYADKEAGEKEEAEEKEEAGENKSADIKLLQDSVVALKSSNPELAEALTKYADGEAEDEEGEK